MLKALRSLISKLCGPELSHWKLLLFWPVYGLAFFTLEWVFPQAYYLPMYHPLDDMIPFAEIFVIPYVFWYIYMIGSVAYTFFKDTAAFRRMMYFYMIVFGVSTLVFFFYPTRQDFRPEAFPRDNVLTQTMALLYSMDTNTNVCPSLHVSGSIGAALAFLDTKRFSTIGWKWTNWIIATLISVSTVFVKQHSVIDVFWGVILSAVAWWIVYKRPIKNRSASFRRGSAHGAVKVPK